MCQSSISESAPNRSNTIEQRMIQFSHDGLQQSITVPAHDAPAPARNAPAPACDAAGWTDGPRRADGRPLTGGRMAPAG